MCSKLNSEACGSSTAHVPGSPSTAPGSNVAATTATAFQRTVIAATLVRITRSESTAPPWRCMAGVLASSTAVFGSASLTPGRNTGQTTGTKTMMCTSTTPETAITCTTAGIPALEFHISVFGQQGGQLVVWQQYRARNWRSQHRTWRQRGGYNGYRIPDDRFRGYFGPDHSFRIYSAPVEVYGGRPRFQYGGFWFSVVDPWPEYWSNNWYENDDVYIDYSGDGYYLYNRRHPRDRVAISVYVD